MHAPVASDVGAYVPRRHVLRHEHAPTASEVAGLHELFERQADRCPDRPAVTHGASTLSYRELEERANQLARFLRGQGVGPGDLVALYLERSATAIVAVLACFKAGAAYVPLDPFYPSERIRFILEHAGVAAVLTEEALLEQAVLAFSGRVVPLDRDWSRVAEQPTARLGRAEVGTSADNLAYVIYTSGTTGRPKGVMTEHRSVVHFVSAFNEVCGVTEADRIFQGFSLSFDGSVEEIWMALAHGASLIVPPGDVARIGSEVGRVLTEYRASIFSTVPTMLSTIEAELPTLRLLILSGEVCTPDIVRRWARPGRRLLNVYGPTETTVNATVEECVPGRPVTIGRPLAGYLTYILDERLQPVPDGASGELHIGGPGLARGYLGLPEQTGQHFIENPIAESRSLSSRLYKTGDLARVTPDGTIDYLGRLDGQVKVRGFRVELGEIEAVLRECPGVVVAAVTVTDRGGPQLAAYVSVDAEAGSLDRDAALQRLRDRLPDYMVPAFLDVLVEFPRLTSGKIDRRALPAPERPLVRGSREIVPPRTDAERRMLDVWERGLKVTPISVTDNFFIDLGGHSLLAAQTVSALRRELGLDVAVRDVYRWPTIEGLAAHSAPAAVPEESAAKPEDSSSRAAYRTLSWGTRFTVPLLQALSMYVLYFVTSWQLIATVLLVLGFLTGQVTLEAGVGVLAALVVVSHPLTLLLSVAAKWLLIGRYRPGRHPVWGFYYLRWWLVERLTAAANPGWLAGTPLMNVYFRLMGARVGRGAIIDTPYCCAFDLVSIGKGAAIGADSHILGYRVEDGMLVFGTVTVGDGCYVGIHSSLGLDSRMGKASRLGDLSLLADGHEIPDGGSRVGSPAVEAAVDLPRGRHGRHRTFLFGCGHVLAIVALEFVVGLASLPVLALVVAAVWLAVMEGAYWGIPLVLFVTGPINDLSFCLISAAFRAMVWRDPRPGTYPVDSLLYLRKWSADFLMGVSRTAVLPLYTTLYLPPWLRLLGARVGPRAELSTVSQISPEGLDIGEESFLADGVVIGRRKMVDGCFQIGVNRIGRRTFVGNNSLMPVGASLGPNSLLGVLSTPPADGAAEGEGDWLGSPAFRLPARQKVGGFADAELFRPSRATYARRLFVDGIRIVAPGIITTSGFIGFLAAAYGVYLWLGLTGLVVALPVLSFGIAMLEYLAVVVMKLSFMGRFRPVVKPLWSGYVWLNEAVNGSYETVAVGALSPFLGTPFLGPLLRLLGCRIGRRVFLASILFSEFDLIEIGDHSAVNLGAVLQTHLFEDRIMKSSFVRIEDECSIGNHAVVLYDSLVQRGTKLAPLSLVMKGEVLPPFTSWSGIPIGSRATADAG